MALVEHWIGEFIARHTSRCPRADWPRQGEGGEVTEEFFQFFDAWRHAFVVKGVEERWADLASLDMAGDPPRFLGDHLPALVKLAVEYRLRDDAGARGGEIGGPDAARLASRDCWDCGGSGFAIRHVHEAIHGKVRTAGGEPAPVGMGVAYPCSCPLGKLAASGLRQQGQARDPLTVDEHPSLRLRPVPWDSGHPAGLDNQFRHRPERWDDDRGRPRAPEIVVASRDEGLEMLRSLVSASRMPRDASRGRGGMDRPSRPHGRNGDPSAARESRPDLAAPVPDPVLDKERTPTLPVVREIPAIPEDDLGLSAWY